MAGAEENISPDGTNRNAHEREIERLNRLYAALSELNQIVVRVKSREELFREVCRITTAKAGFKVAWVGCPEPETHRVIPIARDGDKQDYLDEIRVYADDRPEGRGPTGTAIREDKLCIVNDFAGDPRMAPWQAAAAVRGLRAVASLPIRFQGAVWGALTIYDSEPNVFQDKEIALLEEVVAAIAFALESLNRELQRKAAEEALKQEYRTLKHLLQSSDHERQTIAYDIHDGLAQHLAAAIMQFQTFNHLKDKNPKLAAKAYDVGMTMLQQGHYDARRLIAGVRPPVLDEEGVVEAVAHLVNEQSRLKGPKIEYRSSVGFDRLATTVENVIYRVVQAALTNACQHSKSEKVQVSLLQQEDRVRIEIRDWGVGFDTKTVRENHFGLEGIRQRARLLGGKCSIKSKPGEGTTIIVDLPVVERESEP
jgi:signal transduction histidine kinase